MSLLTEMISAVETYRDVQCILVSPERMPELLDALNHHRWYNNDTGEIVGDYMTMRGAQDARDADGAIVRLDNIPVFEDRDLRLPIFTSDHKRILFYVRRLQENGVNILQGWNEKAESKDPAKS